MRLVAPFVAVVAAAGLALALTPLAGAVDLAQPGTPSLGAAPSVAVPPEAGIDRVATPTALPDDAGLIRDTRAVVDDVASTGIGTTQGIVDDLPVDVPVDVAGLEGGGTGRADEAAAPEPARAQSAAPIAAVGSAAAAWHLRFVPWRRIGVLASRFLPAVPVLGLFSRIDDDALMEHPVRARILQVLEEKPGASILELQEEVDVAWGTVVYHLGRLSQARHVVSQKDGRNHRFWTERDPEARHRKAAFVLKRPTPAAIAATVRAEPGIHQGALCDRLEIRPATASKYLKRLAEEGLVSVTARAQRRHYYPTPSLEAMAPLAEVHLEDRGDARGGDAAGGTGRRGTAVPAVSGMAG